MATFGLSSAWLYSPGPEKAREWFARKIPGLAALTYCQLCASYWFGLMIALCTTGLPYCILLALGYSGISWFLGAITNAALWIKAAVEYEYTERTK